MTTQTNIFHSQARRTNNDSYQIIKILKTFYCSVHKIWQILDNKARTISVELVEICNFCLRFSKNFASNKHEIQYSFELNKEYFKTSHKNITTLQLISLLLSLRKVMIDEFVILCLKYVYFLKTPNEINSAIVWILKTEYWNSKCKMCKRNRKIL